ncbi:MAG TPA: hypothetical protein VE954_02560 [Oligoflexus sp.]|uniref:hypothetical protein n=1 Tax=Oligoflexus sp. TaxID=1971216 RepID=UPI002D6D8A8F|nr:hypothetical protein [Oligoflexus sp.]HYX31969.1 hypothetical protein [Oligoflexus sp.]
MKHTVKLALLSSALLSLACQPTPDSDVKVTSVAHTPVKRQAIGNCWLYAHATWLESLLKHTTGQEINVSETYWTYWDLYEKIINNEPIPEKELNAGGTWYRSKSIIQKYGWVEEGQFIATESEAVMSASQDCAEAYILQQGKAGGTLYGLNSRTPENVKAELNKAFSCYGLNNVNMDEAWNLRRKAEDTMLKDVKSGQEATLAVWLNRWQEISSPGYNAWGPYEGKKLGSVAELDSYKKIEQRIKKALNDHQPVVVAFFVSFNAPDPNGYFNLNTLAKSGSLGDNGGHMVVLHDYTVKDIPEEEGFTTLGEGDMAPELKEAALKGNLDYLVAKNSWGFDRTDRPWLKNGYSRITWDYLVNRYFDEDTNRFQPFFRSVVLPPGY